MKKVKYLKASFRRCDLSGRFFWSHVVSLKETESVYVWAFHQVAPMTVFCCIRQDSAHWHDQVWPFTIPFRYNGYTFQLVYNWDSDKASEIFFLHLCQSVYDKRPVLKSILLVEIKIIAWCLIFSNLSLLYIYIIVLRLNQFMSSKE